MAPKKLLAVRHWGQSPSTLSQPNPITALGLSSDGRFAVTADRQGSIRVFELAAQRLVATVKVPRKWMGRFGGVEQLSVSNDGETVAARVDRALITGPVGSWEPSYLGDCDRGLIGPDGSWAARLKGWLHFHQGEGEPRSHWEKQSGGTDLAFSARGDVVASFSRRDAGVLRVMSSSASTVAVLELSEDLLQASVGFVDDETVLAVTSLGRVHQWTVGSAKVRSWTLSCGAVSSSRVLLAPLKVVIDEEQNLIDLESGKVRRELDSSLWAVSADGSVLLSADGATLTRRGTDLFEPFAAQAPTSPVRAVAFEKSGEWAWSGDDEALRRWRVRDGQVDTAIPLPKGQRSAALTDRAALAVLRRDDTLTALALPAGSPQGKPQTGCPRLPAVSPDGTQVVVLRDRLFQVVRWNGTVVSRRKLEPVAGVAFSPDGRFVATGGSRGQLAVVEASTGELVRSFTTPSGRPAFAIAFSPDGKRLSFCCDTAAIYVVSARDGRQVHALRGLSHAASSPAVFCPRGRWLAASDDVRTCVWDLKTGKRHFAAETRSWSLAFSPDGKRLLMGNSGTVSELLL